MKKYHIETSEARRKEDVARGVGFYCYLAAITLVGFTEPAYADWFKVGDVKAELITPAYNLVNENLGFVAFAMGGVATFFARGGDMWQKGLAFGLGSLGTAAGVKLSKTVMHLP